MVFTSAVNFIRSRGPDEFWRKRKIFKLAAHYFGRPRNCYSLSIRNVQRALAYATKGRKLKKIDMLDLWTTRITAACNQHEIEYGIFKTSLRDLGILLNKKVLSDLAIWEPYSFKALTDIAKRKALDDGLPSIKNETEVSRIITRGMLSTHK
ncbi:large ribosomal subunit protein bL20m [Euwallacea fornicatus]|uniref:large ribosomal subunit protein bL20m n=1 Tax=Euwallacea fornicatus TaxID=995702 RepID=UPI00338E6F5B